ncbi:MAG: AGE family epimerase/isomerase [Saonia sp.]
MQSQIEFSKKLDLELKNILDYWQNNSIDCEFGGFVGRIDHHNKVDKEYPKSIVLNTRILWTFSKANNFYKDRRYNQECQRAFDYLFQNFKDKKNGGVYWEVDYLGKPSNKRKQIYAQAFCIYALSEYHKYSKNPKAILWAMELFQLVEDKAHDRELNGYIEAFDETWKPIEDVRLSKKDLNAPKTTNTHLHILEAYTALFEITADIEVEKSLKKLLALFLGRIFAYNYHLKLFFSKDWKTLSTEISYGHDIEAAWLLVHAAQTTGDVPLILQTEKLLISVVETFASEALDTDFGVWNSKDHTTLEMDKDKHWWPQAEAMVGLVYAWKITKNRSYFNICLQVWDFIETHIIDHENGEWFFRVNPEGIPSTVENKIGPWKCPYHNGRALMEILSILDNSQVRI